jgi:hypothetical protein
VAHVFCIITRRFEETEWGLRKDGKEIVYEETLELTVSKWCAS